MSDAKVLTTAEVDALPMHAGGPTAYRYECPNHVLVRRADLLATTRALETENDREMTRYREAIAKAVDAERELDEARATVAELVDLVRRDVEMSGKECWEYAKGAARGQSTCTHPKCAWLHDARAALAKAKEAKP